MRSAAMSRRLDLPLFFVDVLEEVKQVCGPLRKHVFAVLDRLVVVELVARVALLETAQGLVKGTRFGLGLGSLAVVHVAAESSFLEHLAAPFTRRAHFVRLLFLLL